MCGRGQNTNTELFTGSIFIGRLGPLNPNLTKIMKYKIPLHAVPRAVYRLFTGATAPLILVFSITHVWGQETGAENSVVELSPFEVTPSETTGFRAASTLSGTRLKTDIGDLGSSISVYTEQFLEDTGSEDMEDLLVYATGMEVPGISGNLTNTEIAGGGAIGNQESTVRPQENTRARGLAPADLTRDLYLTDIPFDAYNIHRVTINRGSNALLFGLGSPAGIIDHSLVNARFEDSGEVVAKFDSFGTQRYSLDLNRVLLEDRLAFRFAGLYEDQKYNVEPAFEKDERLFLAAVYRPLKQTTIRVNFEHGENRSNRPRLSPPIDLFTPHFETENPRYPTTNLLPNGIAFHDPAKETRGAFWNAHAGTFNPTILLGSSDVTTSPDLVGFEPLLLRRIDPDIRPDLPSFPAHSIPTVNSRGRLPVGTPFASLYIEEQVTDPSVFDFNNLLIDGPNKEEYYNFETYNITAEQLFLSGNAGVELAYDYQEFDDGRFYLFNQSRSGERLAMDANITLTDGRTNPNFGRPFLSGRPGADMRLSERDAFRIQAFIKFDFGKLESGLPRLLGRHVLTGQYFTQTHYEKRVSTGSAWQVPEEKVDAFSTRSNDVITLIRYLGPSVIERGVAEGAHIPNIQVPTVLQTAESFWMYNNKVTHEWELFTFETYDWRRDPASVAGGASLLENQFDATMGVLQSWFLDDHLVATVGYRNDEAKGRENVNPPRDDARGVVVFDDRFFQLPDQFGTEATEESWSWSLVGHVPESLLEAVPAISGVSLHYSESQNFRPSPNRFNVIGEEIGSPGGETREYGFSLDLWEDRVNLRVNWYETAERLKTEDGFTSLGGWINFEAFVLENIESTIANEAEYRELFPESFANTPPFEQLRGAIEADGSPKGFPKNVLAFANYTAEDTTGDGLFDEFRWSIPSNTVSTSDVVSKGVEIELVGNPTPNWTIILNIAQQQATRANSGPAVRELVAARLPFIEEFGSFPNGAGQQTVAGWLNANNIVPAQKVISQDGKGIANEVREWRVNLASTVRFSDGRWKGLFVGGGIRWQDDAAIGFLGKDDPVFGEIFDVDQPVFGESEFDVDAWIGYEKRVWDKYDWKIQLNIRNLTNDDDLVPTFANPDGSVAGWRIQQPIRFELTNKLRF